MCDRLDRAALRVGDRTEDVCRALHVGADEFAHPILHHVTKRLADAGFPRHKDGVDPVRVEARPHSADELNRLVLAVQSAECVDHELSFRGAALREPCARRDAHDLVDKAGATAGSETRLACGGETIRARYHLPDQQSGVRPVVERSRR
jgi:hypothetical protein